MVSALTKTKQDPGAQIFRPVSSQCLPICLKWEGKNYYERAGWDDLLTEFAEEKFTDSIFNRELFEKELATWHGMRNGEKAISPGLFHTLSAVASGKMAKSPGYDDVTRELLRGLPLITKHRLHWLFAGVIGGTVEIPDNWRRVLLGGHPKDQQPYGAQGRLEVGRQTVSNCQDLYKTYFIGVAWGGGQGPGLIGSAGGTL